MFDYTKSPFWKKYIASLENEADSGLGGFCEYLSDRLEAAEQSAKTGGTHAPSLNKPLGGILPAEKE